MITSNSTSHVAPIKYVAGLNSLRFISALWVFLFHWGAAVDRNTLWGVWGAVFCGPAAVIVFFVISGFCVHYPFRANSGDFPIFPFLTRRYLRVLVPLLIARYLSPSFHISTEQLINAVGWSLIVELVFYSLYPFIRFPVTTHGWLRFLACFFVLGYLVIAWRGFPRDYGSWGHQFNWILAFPCWLLGCLLASQFDRFHSSTLRCPIWVWRGSAWAAGTLCAILHYHSPIPYSWSLNLFAILVFFWIRAELIQQHNRPISRFMEWGGLWSYSIYLVHGFGLSVIDNWAPWPHLFWLQMAIKGLVVLGICYLFYILVEKPSHWVARRITMAVSKISILAGNPRL
ncbi:MAG: acyltransferase [bacterium]